MEEQGRAAPAARKSNAARGAGAFDDPSMPPDAGIDINRFWTTAGRAPGWHQDLAGLHETLADPERVRTASRQHPLRRKRDRVRTAARPRAPADCRVAASRLLFAIDRPHFQTL